MLRGVERLGACARRTPREGWCFPAAPGFQFKMPKPGNDIILTIDEVIQHIVEKELDAALASSHAKGGVCIVMNPHSGEILALSVRSNGHGRPAFNPNEPQRYKPAEWRNRAVTDAFEPGSIFKPILAAAALEEKVVHPLERFDCSAGKIQVADRVINDAHENGVLTFTDVIAQSSNVGTIKVGPAARKGPVLQIHYRLRVRPQDRRGPSRRDPGPAQGLPSVVRRVDRRDRHRPGNRRHADADGRRVLRARERRNAHEALHRVRRSSIGKERDGNSHPSPGSG